MSLSDIAATLGLSKTTVSWVLSGQGDSRRISPATQKKVRDYVREHNYQPNMLARSLSLGVTKTVGLLISSLTDPFYSSIAKAVVEEAEQFGYTVMIATSESDHQREEQLVDSLSRRQVDGFISTPTEGAGWIGPLIDRGGNVVLVDRPVPGIEAPCIGVDNEESSYKLVSHLISKGCRKIAIFITAHNLVNMQLREAGYRKALQDAGIEVDDRLICNVPPQASVEQIDSRLDELLSEVPDLDGIFFTSHVLVLPVYVRLVDRGVDVAKGRNWVCVHSLPEFGVLLPQMSIAHMDIAQLGAKAMDMLVAKIEGGESQAEQDVAPEQPVVIECKMMLK